MPPIPKLTNRGAAGLLGKMTPEMRAALGPVSVPQNGESRIRAPYRIAPALAHLAVPIASLVPDPDNARLHPERNMEAIKASLTKYGQVKPVVVRSATRVVVAGNGTMAAAKELGWDEIAATFVDMNEVEAAGYGLADNRTAELAAWDFEIMARLDKLLQEAGDQPVGLSQDELTALRADWSKFEFGQGAVDDEEVPEQTPGDAEFLAKLNVTVGESQTQVSTGDVYYIGQEPNRHTLVVADVVHDVRLWKPYLTEEHTFCPYPGPLVLLTLKAGTGKLLLVQPDLFIAGHVLDKYKEVYPEGEVTLATN